MIRFTPEHDPFLSLAKALVKNLVEIDVEPLDRLSKANDLAKQLRENSSSQVNLLDLLTDDTILLFIDQFEELFTLASDTDREAFAELIKHESSQVRVLATMRADFYESATPYFEQQLRQNFTLAQPSPFALYEMVVEPAKLAGFTFDTGLPEQIVTDLGDQPGALALMAYLLEQLYIRANENDKTLLSQADYDALGGVQKAIGTHAEHIYQQLPLNDDDKDAWMQRVFHELVSVDERGTATRRRVSIDRIKEADLEWVNRFVDARLLVSSVIDSLTDNTVGARRGVSDGTTTVEVAHEALFRSWERLVDWIIDAQEDLLMIRRMERDAQTWHERVQKLLDDATDNADDLIQMLDHLRPNAETLKEFTQACQRLSVTVEDDILIQFTEPEQDRLLRELETLPKDATSHERRRDIGDRVAVIGDTRKGVGVVDGLPDIEWIKIQGTDDHKVQFRDQDTKVFGEFKVPDFYMSKYLVTYAQYQVFADSDYDNPLWWDGFPSDYQQQRLRGQRTKIANLPRDTISWYQSVAFSRWLDAQLRNADLLPDDELELRIPTEQEWQWVAMDGDDTCEYPWGDWQEGYANTSDAGLSRTTAVGMYPHGQSVSGVLDMSGNLREWCLNDYDNPDIMDGYGNQESRVLRGGSFGGSFGNNARVSSRSNRNPNNDHFHYGIRLVVSRPPS